MFTVINPQPIADDISFWSMVYSEHLGGWGLSASKDDPVGNEFIPLPQGISPVGMTVVKRNNLWYWARPAFYNLSNPKYQVIEALTPLGVFDERQMRLIANCVNYQQNDPAGLGCHQANLLVSKLYVLLYLTLALIDPEEKARIIEAYWVIMGGK